MLKEGDITILNQLTDSIEKSLTEMKKALGKKDSEKFNEAKKSLIQAQKEIFAKIQ